MAQERTGIEYYTRYPRKAVWTLIAAASSDNFTENFDGVITRSKSAGVGAAGEVGSAVLAVGSATDWVCMVSSFSANLTSSGWGIGGGAGAALGAATLSSDSERHGSDCLDFPNPHFFLDLLTCWEEQRWHFDHNSVDVMSHRNNKRGRRWMRTLLSLSLDSGLKTLFTAPNHFPFLPILFFSWILLYHSFDCICGTI